MEAYILHAEISRSDPSIA